MRMTKSKKLNNKYEAIEDNLFFGHSDSGVYSFGNTMNTHIDYCDVKAAIEKVYNENPLNSNRELEILNIKIIGKVKYK